MISIQSSVSQHHIQGKWKNSVESKKNLTCSYIMYTFQCKANGAGNHIDHVLVSDNL